MHSKHWIYHQKWNIFFSFQIFGAPSFDDKILEVVAVFGSMQMAVSRVIKLQHHRIAQVCFLLESTQHGWQQFGMLANSGTLDDHQPIR